MDLKSTRHYVGISMQLLLLLSALLSAITGGLSSTRGENVRVDQAEARFVAPALVPSRTVAEAPRPAEPCARPRRSAEASGPAQPIVPRPAPLASICLIE